jgi:meiotically up-regulated gene 157 (Mug157) protein
MAFALLALLCIMSSSESLSTAVPDARPPVNQRRFQSAAVESEIVRVTTALRAVGAADFAQLFANTFPNTLDTTVSFVDSVAFVITGDIDAMWLRDSTNQVLPYVPLASQDPSLAHLLASLIKRQASFINIDPYANALYARPDQVSPWATDATKTLSYAGTKTNVRNNMIHERKFEIDSHGSFMQLAAEYFAYTNDSSPFDAHFRSALQSVLGVLTLHAELDTEATRGAANAPYSFQRLTEQPSDTLQFGVGAPAKACGLIRSAFRPSDDALVLPFNIPQNMFVATQLKRMANVASQLGWTSEASSAAALAASVTAAIMKFGVVRHPSGANVFAYEIDGFGNALFQDDANLPSLLSAPFLGFVAASDPVYVATRKILLSNQTNPFFFRGGEGEGIGSPHTGFGLIWPMSVVVRAFTSSDSTEIKRCLRTLLNSTAGTGLMHESFDRDDARTFTRPWFAWANTLFAHLVQHLLATNPSVFQ